jgi:kinesin family member 11
VGWDGRARRSGGCCDFTLDDVSVSEEEDLEGFYRRFVPSRIQGVRVGAKCTVMVYR